MSIVIFSGTTEGRKISEYLSANAIPHHVCVATKSGEVVMDESEFANVHIGRLDRAKLEAFFDEIKPELVLDATHPYATVVTDNLQQVCGTKGIKYKRVNRESDFEGEHKAGIHYYESAAECAKALGKVEGNVLLTTGSKELSCYTAEPDLSKRLFVRVLPTMEAIGLCKQAKIGEKQIIAMYGPHTREMNAAVLKQYDIAHLVTKESGAVGGFLEKLEAAFLVGTQVHIIERPENSEGISIEECISFINKELNIRERKRFINENLNIKERASLIKEEAGVTCDDSTGFKSQGLKIKLVGLGPGDESLLTGAAKNAIESADYIFGAHRMLEACNSLKIKPDAKKVAEYLPDKIIGVLRDIADKNVVALFSGDTGLYSGATKLYKELVKWGKCQSIEIIPGVSSFSAFSAALGVEYTGAYLESLHGKSEDQENLTRIKRLIDSGERVFLLMSNKADFEILETLLPEGFSKNICIGRNISYPDEQIVCTGGDKMLEAISNLSEGLFVVLINSGND